MIKIDANFKNIEDTHWDWFKEKLLKNWINKINGNIILKKVFFESEAAFKNWFDRRKNESTEKWINRNDDSKFEIFKKFVIGSRTEMNEVNKRIEKLLSNIPDSNLESIKTYFENQYKKFRESGSGWGGSAFVKELDVRVCPYCNRSFVDTYQLSNNKKLKTVAELDHFYSKTAYPQFALNIHNLVPCCSTCNFLKLDIKKEVVYPYEEKFGDNAKFELDFCDDNDFFYLLGNSQNFKLNLIVKKSGSDEENQNTEAVLCRINQSISTFELIERYSSSKAQVQDLIRKSIVYNESRIEELRNSFPELFSCRTDVVNMIVSNNIYDLGKQPLGKLTKDICEDIGLIKSDEK